MQLSSTWSVVCLDPGVWRAWLPQHPIFIHPAYQLILSAFSVCVAHHAVHSCVSCITHTHTHTQPVFTRAASCPALVPADPELSWTLPLPWRGVGSCLDGTVTQTGSSGSSKAISGTLAGQRCSCTRGFPELPSLHPLPPCVPLPWSLPVLELEVEPRSLRGRERGSKNGGEGGGGSQGWAEACGGGGTQGGTWRGC